MFVWWPWPVYLFTIGSVTSRLWCFAMSASVSVALQSVNLFVPCPLHCMFAQDLVSACLDVFGWSYLPVEIRLHVCLFNRACLVIQVLSCSHKTQRLFAHLFTCPYVSVHVFLFTQINTCTKSGLFSLASVLRTQYQSAHVLPVCTSACLHICLCARASTWLYMRLIVYTYVYLFHMWWLHSAPT